VTAKVLSAHRVHQVRAARLVQSCRRLQRDTLAVAAPPQGPSRTGIVDQNAPHHLRGYRQKVRAVLPPDTAGVDQPQIGFVDQSRGFKGVVQGLAAHITVGQTTQLRVNQGDQPVEGGSFPAAPCQQQFGDFAVRFLAHSSPR
jgi:hypothetical protein